MTNHDDPRTPQERAYDPAEQASDETVQWSRPGDDPTQQIGPVGAPIPDQATEQYYTADPYQAYGAQAPNPTQAIPTYDPRFDPQATPANATQAYPTYYGAGGYPPGGYPPPGQPPTGEVPPVDNTPAPKPGRKIGMWAAVGAGVVLLGLGLIVGLLLSGNDSNDTNTAAAPSPRTSAPVVPPRAGAPTPTDEPDITSPLEGLPGGVGDLIGKAGTAMGTITANNGGTLTIDGLGGSKITVRTTSDTTLISLTADSIADLKPGESVLVQGDKVENDTVTAKLIIGTTLPEFGN
ncbi:hypothetical protein C8K36_10120 [Rhodococcus sp. OK519]|uniref:DUF5666 domain-containing protein n=1 Tax=Rhodococcus sp. OK519 TaxID=2135729 RepID=UPI000D3B44E0|nr:hypothetical protein C8K36_10120 [Rhodococcus sp. OK519]